MYETSAPSPAYPSSAPATEGAPGTPRHVYLLGRLRSRQITMEEATELFSIQQGMIRAAARSAPPSVPARPAGTSPGASAGPVAGLSMMSDEGLALALLAMGAGAGVLAAVLKRNAEGPKPAPSSRR